MIYTPENHNLSKIGGKAAALAKLAIITDNIPEWFVVGTDGANEDEVITALNKFDDSNLFAVRSSATIEDGSDNSFAGQFESYLNVPKSEVFKHITAVQESALSERVQTYMRECGITGTATPAVLVQRMVAADSAGVAFGANPVTGNTTECVISAVAGLGDKLVDGTVDGETYIVPRGRQAACPHPYGNSPLLSPEQCQEITALCKKTSHFFGHYQDIEWAYENGKLYLLQSRPITSLRKFSAKTGYINIWDNSNIAESYNGITTPLTFSFIRMAYEHVYREMCRMLGVPEQKIAENDYIFTHMLGLCDGQVYYNLLSWYKLVAILPGYKTNAAFMEQMMGVKEGLSPEVRELLPPPSDATMFTAVRKLWKHHRRNEKHVADFFSLLGDTIDFSGNSFKRAKMLPDSETFSHASDSFRRSLIKTCDLSELTLFELAQYYRELECKLLKKWDAPVINDFFSMIFYGMLKNTSQKWCNIKDENKFNGLLRNTGDIISAEPAQLVRAIAETARADAKLVESLVYDDVFTIQKRLYGDVKTKIDEYLDKFGNRCINELKLESETLFDDPLSLYRAIGNYAVKLNNGDVREIMDDFDENEIINKAPLHKRPIYKWILKNARRTIRNRENLRFERTRVFGTVRSIFREIGMRLASFRVIDARDDIFYLELGEVLAYIEGTATTQNLRGLVDVRKKEFAAFGRIIHDRFETFDCVSLSSRHMNQADTCENTDMLNGLGCCPGIVRGRARVITDPKNAVIHPGEILVAQRTDPGWIMLFPVAAGVLVEYGSLLSHAAIVVREMGIPAVVSVKNLFANVKTGDLLELDGEKGTVRILP